MFTSNVPVLLVSSPGMGKTSHIRSSFDYVEVMLASCMVEEDIAGIPYRDGNYDYKTTPSAIRRLHEADAEGKTTALFFDEIDKARRSVADTLLTLIASRCIGQAFIPEKTCIIAAANPPEFGGGDGISDAMINRCAVINFVPSVSKWVKWASGQYKSVMAQHVIKAVQDEKIGLVDMVGDGLERRITSPRSLAMALNYMENGDKQYFEQIVRGLLTANTASIFLNVAMSHDNDVMEDAISVRMKSKSSNKKPMVF